MDAIFLKDLDADLDVRSRHFVADRLTNVMEQGSRSGGGNVGADLGGDDRSEVGHLH